MCCSRRDPHARTYWSCASRTTRSRKYLLSEPGVCSRLATHEQRELVLKVHQREAWNVPRLELDENVHVAVGAKVVAQNRAKESQSPIWCGDRNRPSAGDRSRSSVTSLSMLPRHGVIEPVFGARQRGRTATLSTGLRVEAVARQTRLSETC